MKKLLIASTFALFSLIPLVADAGQDESRG